ncbi:glycosyltransferase family 87 protein [Amycolatopsis sp. H20-H5]|uniref:glycosyltransferase family 87 protein n=1 Tax=Amycolatopsis sp. H20-H5 TaxID=3046309 RepID=UPI002DBF05BA|nr:glycosyltransferase family 87 protein [Amycolatopsis sp. H20-H5]MEC3976625.1 glycosyltransferase family 87 protein [Amycolatopsis sp. H20-H5]
MSAPRLQRLLPRNKLVLDLLLYLGFFVFALSTALAAEFYGYRIWGNFATVGYGLAAAFTGWSLLSSRRGAPQLSRWVPIAVIGVLAMVVPLAVLVVRRLTGVDWLITPGSWSAQPEVWVIERSASLLLEHGTPYVDFTTLGRSPVVNDYTPYGPVMAVFGLPRALFGGGPLANALTDARWMFALAACLCVLATLRLLKWPKIPVGAAQLALACPLTALTWAVAGPDLAIAGLLVLSCALASTGRAVVAGLVLALVISAKLIVLPAAVVLGVLLLTRRGPRALGGFVASLLVTTAVLHVPVYLANPPAFVEHVIRFPLGMGVVTSPAASPLPGHLIAATGPAGTVIAFVLLGAAASAVALWLSRRPPVNGSDALLRIAVGLGALILLTPATRYGYLVYPLILLGALLVFRRAEDGTAPPAQPATSS